MLPGDRLLIGSGTYSIAAFFRIDLQGTAVAPIAVEAAPGAAVVITRPDPFENVINVGRSAPARFLALRGLEIEGGDTGLRLWDCENIWIDRCHIHHCGGPGLSANAVDTGFLYITRNEIDHTGGSAEGLYLGGNGGSVIMRHSIVALNHVHDTRGSQGDGIELKQGSFGNWIVENHVHDTRYPCILVFGTDGRARNLIERNVCYRSDDNVLQVQGEAVVRNNLLIGGARGFESFDHQGQTRDLVVVHNTIVTTGRGANLASWNGRPGMVFANNAVYSQAGDAIRAVNGAAGVAFSGNVAFGGVIGFAGGYATGSGLGDFRNVTWDATQLDARPRAAGAIIGTADPLRLVPRDLLGRKRLAPLEAGCLEGF